MAHLNIRYGMNGFRYRQSAHTHTHTHTKSSIMRVYYYAERGVARSLPLSVLYPLESHYKEYHVLGITARGGGSAGEGAPRDQQTRKSWFSRKFRLASFLSRDPQPGCEVGRLLEEMYTSMSRTTSSSSRQAEDNQFAPSREKRNPKGALLSFISQVSRLSELFHRSSAVSAHCVL